MTKEETQPERTVPFQASDGQMPKSPNTSEEKAQGGITINIQKATIASLSAGDGSHATGVIGEQEPLRVRQPATTGSNGGAPARGLPMTIEQARLWLVKASLILTASLICFFLAAPMLGYPLEFSQSLRLAEIVVPPFLAYIGSAAQFVVRRRVPHKDEELSALHDLIVRGPVLLVAFLIAGTMLAFAWSNSARAEGVGGLSLDALSLILCFLIGVLAATTNVVAAYLFPVAPPPQERKEPRDE